MKLRVKYTNTQKFTIEIEELTYKNLKTIVSNYISSTYGIYIDNISLSFNGKEPINGHDDSLLSTLGIVSGDLLVVLQSSDSNAASSSVEPSPSQNKPKMERKPEKESSDAVDSNLNVSNLLEARDGNPPPSVVQNFDLYGPCSASNALNILIHTAMLEAGFILGDSPANSSCTLPSCWKDMAATINYHNPGFLNFNCRIIMVTMGGIKQVLASFSDQEEEISVRLEIKDYIPSDETLPHRLTKLSQLAMVLRNNLLYPLKVAAHLTLGLPTPWHLAGLPEELLVKIMSLLDLPSVLKMASTCKRLLTSLEEKKMWFNLFRRDFKDQFHCSDTVSGADWRAKYKAAFERQKGKQDCNEGQRCLILEEPHPGRAFPPIYPNNPDDPFQPYMPRGPHPYYPPQPDHPQPNPFWDPDSPYFGGEVPPPPGPLFPGQPDPFDPFGGRGPRRPNNPLRPPFMPPSRNPRGGPRINYF